MATNDLLPTALVATGALPAAVSKLFSAPAAPARDQFAKQAGPDVSFKGPDGLTEAYAVFQIDPESKQLQVMVVDSDGRILRAIPPRSVNQMIETMSRYRP
ncbi:MAG TPA: hypothetical protein VF375_01225 [Candidatus Limnocylindrales bacterium]|jgi:hypothetical protein